MNRRNLLQMIAAATGTAMIGAPAALAWQPTESGPNLFDEADAAFWDELAEVILPQTDTPGAKAAGVGAFMTAFVSDCWTPEQQEEFREARTRLDDRATVVYGAPFLDLPADQRLVLVEDIAAQARFVAKDSDKHWFTPIQQLVIFGFFTSEVGATEVLRYEPVPGEYIGDLDYDGGPAWAT